MRRETGRNFTTNIGVPQGDSLSPLLFTLYLAQALKPPSKQQHINEHNYTKLQIATENLLPKCQLDHAYSIPAEEDIRKKKGVHQNEDQSDKHVHQEHILI